MSDNLTFDLIVKDDSEKGLSKFANNLSKAGKRATESGRHVAAGLDAAGESADRADGKMGKLAGTLDKIKGKFAEAKEKGVSPLLDGLVALGPALVPIATAGIPAVIGLGAAFAGAAAAGGLFKAVLTQTLAEVQDDAKNLDTMQDKIAALGDTARLAGARGDGDAKKSALAQQKVAIQQYQDALKQMDPDQRKAVQNYRMMTNTWQQFLDKNKPATFGILSQGYDLIKMAIGNAQPLFDAAANAASGFLNRVGDWAQGGGLKSLIDFLAKQATQTFAKVEIILRNVVRGFGPLFKLTAGQGQGFLHWIVTLSAKFATFGQGGGWERFLAYTSANAPAVQAIIGNLVQIVPTLVQSFQQLSPLAGVSIALAGALSQIIAAIPPEALTAIVAGFIAYSTVMKLHTVYTIAANVATKAWAATQWILNAALTANPIGLVVVAVVALIGVIVLVATKTRFFQTVWSKSFAIIKIVAAATWRAIKATASGLFAALKLYVTTYFKIWKTIFTGARIAAVAVFHAVQTVARTVAGAVSSAWRTAINRTKVLIQSLRTKAGDVFRSIRSLFSPSALYAAGQKLIIGLAKGIASKASAPINAVKGILSNLKSHLPGSPIKKGPLKPWNNGKVGVKLIGLVTKGVLMGKVALVKAMASVVNVKTPKGSTVSKTPGATALRAIAGAKTKVAVRKLASRASTDLRNIGGAPTKSKKSSSGGGSGGGSGSLTVNFYGVQYGTPEQISKAVISALRQFKASGGTVPFGTFQGGSV